MDAAATNNGNSKLSFVDIVLSLKDPRLWRIFLLGMGSGFPWVLHGSTLTLWLNDLGFSRTSIGLIGLIGVVYTINFLWAPVLDHLRLPLLHRIGQRRSWIFLCQGVLFLCVLALVNIDPSSNLGATAIIVFVIATASATQDMAIDAYRITVIREDEPHLLGHAAAMATSGWWVGVSLPGAVALWVVNDIGWSNTYLLLSVFLILVAMAVIFLFREPEVAAPQQTRRQSTNAALDNILEIFESYIDAVEEFFYRNGVSLAIGLLLFVLLFKVGEAFLGRTVYIFYDEVGYTKEQIGTYSKGIGLLVTICGTILTGFLMARFGTVRGLLAAGIAMAGTNLLFAWIAEVGPDHRLFLLAVVADGLTSAIATVAFVAFISSFTSRIHTATQYAAMASIANASRIVLAAFGGAMVDRLDGNWSLFFVITAFMVVPSLVLLVCIARRIRRITGVTTTAI